MKRSFLLTLILILTTCLYGQEKIELTNQVQDELTQSTHWTNVQKWAILALRKYSPKIEQRNKETGEFFVTVKRRSSSNFVSVKNRMANPLTTISVQVTCHDNKYDVTFDNLSYEYVIQRINLDRLSTSTLEKISDELEMINDINKKEGEKWTVDNTFFEKKQAIYDEMVAAKFKSEDKSLKRKERKSYLYKYNQLQKTYKFYDLAWKESVDFVNTLRASLETVMAMPVKAVTKSQPAPQAVTAQATTTNAFKAFIDTLDWSLTETQLLEKYPQIIRSASHSYSARTKLTSDYEFYNLDFDGHPVKATIYVDSISRKFMEIRMSLSDTYKKYGAPAARVKADNVFKATFGQPDKAEKEGSSLARYYRFWYTPKYNLNLTQMVSTSGLFICSLCVEEGLGNEPDFRDSNWGDTLAQVKAAEKQEDLYPNSDQLYAFSTQVAGKPCTVAFIFSDNKLVMAKYVIKEDHTNRNDYIADYKDLVTLLTSKYGKPDYDSQTWKDDLYKDDVKHYGMAVSSGHLTYDAGWENPSTKLVTALHGDNFKVEHLVQYTSKKYEAMMHKNRQASRAKGL